MSDIKLLLAQTETFGTKLIGFVSKHRTVLLIFVASGAVLAAVMQTQTYLNPERNEDKYTEIRSGVTTKKIDQAIVDKLSQTQEDQNNTVESNFVEDRNNPFTE